MPALNDACTKMSKNIKDGRDIDGSTEAEDSI